MVSVKSSGDYPPFIAHDLVFRDICQPVRSNTLEFSLFPLQRPPSSFMCMSFDIDVGGRSASGFQL